MWVVKGEVGIVGEDLGTKLLISIGPRCPEVEDTEEEHLKPRELNSDIAAGWQRRQQLIVSCRKDMGSHRETCG